MNLTLPDGRNIIFPEGTSESDAQAYIAKNFPSEPNVLERTAGHLLTGASRAYEMLGNAYQYLPFTDRNDLVAKTLDLAKDFYGGTDYAQQIKKYPETSTIGQALGGLAEFVPQIPLYAGGGGLALRGAAKLPGMIGESATKLITRGATPLERYGRAIARGTVEGGVVGGTIGVPEGTPLEKRAVEAGTEAAGFGMAVTALHPIFASLGYIGKGIVRRLRGKATPELVEKELKKKAATNPQAAEELQRLKEAKAAEKSTVVEEPEELYVPGKEAKPQPLQQGQLFVEMPSEDTMVKLRERGYTDERVREILTSDPEGKELVSALEKEVPISDQANAQGIQGGVGGGEKPVSGEPIAGAGEGAAEAGGVFQASEGTGAAQKKALTLQERTDLRLKALGWAEEDIVGMTTSRKIEILKMKEAKGGEPLGQKEEGEAKGAAKAATGKEKITPIQMATLQRMGYQRRELARMKSSEAQAIMDEYDRNVKAVPSAEEAAAAEAASRQAEEANKKAREAIPPEEMAKAEQLVDVIGREEQRYTGLSEEEKAEIAEDTKRRIENVKVDDPQDLGEAIAQLRAMEDPAIDALIDSMPKDRAGINERLRQFIEERNRRLEAEKATVEPKKNIVTVGNKEFDISTREGLNAYRKAKAEVAKGQERRAKRTGKVVDLEAEADRILREAGEFEEDITREPGGPRELDFEEPSGVTLDMFGGQQLFELASKILSGREKIKNAPSNDIIAEHNGRKLTVKDDANFVDGFMAQMAKNFGDTLRIKGMSPDFAFRNNERVGPLVFNIHKKFFEGNFEASKHNEVIRAAETLLHDLSSKEAMKDFLEGKRDLSEATPAQQEAYRLVRGELDAVREKYKQHLRSEFSKNLNKDEFAALVEMMSGKSLDEVASKYEFEYYTDKLGRNRKKKTHLDKEVIKDIYDEYKAIDSWGLEDYVSHYERGPLRIVSRGKLYAKAMSEADAARKFADLVERDVAAGVERDYQIDTKHNLEELATGLSRRSYNRVLYNLQEGLKNSIEGINSQAARRLAQKGLKGRFFIKPTHQFSPYTMDRHEFLQGEKNVFDILYNYMYSMEKKMALDPAIDAIRRDMAKTEVVGTEQYKAKDGTIKEREIKRPYLKEDEQAFLNRYVEDIKGKLYRGDEVVDSIFKNTGNQRLYSRAIQASREAQANMKLGYAPIKGFINGLSGLGHVYTKVGMKHIADGIEFLRTPEGAQFIKAMEPYLGVNIVESATGKLTSRGSVEKILDRYGILSAPEGSALRKGIRAAEPLALFQAPELPVRKLTLASNYLMAKAEGMSEAAARDAAIKANWFQQFTYDMASLPEIMRSPTGRLLMQFKPYLLKELEFISSLRGPEIARYIGMQLALGGPRGAVMIAKSIPILAMFQGWNELEDWMNKEYPRLSRGVGGAAGVDITAAATFQLPASMRDWLGPTISDIVALHKNVIAPLTSNAMNAITGTGIDEKVRFGRAASSIFPIFRHQANLWEQVIDKDGWVKDERGRRLWNIDNMGTFVAKSIAGAEPIELNRLRVAERNLAEKSQLIKDQKVMVIDDVLDSIAKGEPLDKDLMDKMTKFGIQPATLRRAARFRVLDPKQRRLLMTEIIRRPEILEKYPEAADLD